MLARRGFGIRDNSYLSFLGSWEALVVIFRDLGSSFIVRGILEVLQKVKHEFK